MTRASCSHLTEHDAATCPRCRANAARMTAQAARIGQTVTDVAMLRGRVALALPLPPAECAAIAVNHLRIGVLAGAR